MLGNGAIVHFLEDKGIRYIFHLPGIHTLPLNRALAGSKIKVLMGRHESHAGFTADGFSRATGEVCRAPRDAGSGSRQCRDLLHGSLWG